MIDLLRRMTQRMDLPKVHRGPGLEDHLGCARTASYGMGDGYTLIDGVSYCRDACPVKTWCWESTKARTRDDEPAMVEKFERLVSIIEKQKRWSHQKAGTWAATELWRFGTPDPYRRRILHNIDQGMQARKRDEPGVEERLVIGPSDPRWQPGYDYGRDVGFGIDEKGKAI